MSSSRTHYGNVSNLQNKLKITYGKAEVYVGRSNAINEMPNCLICDKAKTGMIPNRMLCKLICGMKSI